MDLEALLTRREDLPPFFFLQRKLKGKRRKRRKEREEEKRGREREHQGEKSKIPQKGLKKAYNKAWHALGPPCWAYISILKEI